MEKKSKILQYLSAYLKRWIKANGLTQAEASLRLSIQQAQLNGILNLTRGISIERMEDICNATRKDSLEALMEGRKLLGLVKKTNENDILNYDQKIAIEAFQFVLLHGGEGAELIEKTVLDFARKKQAETAFQNPAIKPPLSKSA